MNLFDYLNFKNGFYIEVGAHDGIYESNTLFLEKELNWFGLLIEPNEDMLNLAYLNRSNSTNIFCHSALVSCDYPHNTICGSFKNDGQCTQDGQVIDHMALHFDQHKINEINNIKKTRQICCVPAKTLQSIIDDHQIKNIDFLSMDIEGYEEEALLGVDFLKNPPRYALIETGNNKKRENFIDEFMYSQNYEKIYMKKNDTFYRYIR